MVKSIGNSNILHTNFNSTWIIPSVFSFFTIEKGKNWDRYWLRGRHICMYFGGKTNGVEGVDFDPFALIDSLKAIFENDFP